MRFDKFTITSQELIQNSQTLASQYGHQQFEPEHLLAAMLIIMTSNIGSQWIQESAAVSREEMERRVTDALRAHFKPEFLNRIDETIIYQNLTLEQITEIVAIQIKTAAADWPLRISN